MGNSVTGDTVVGKVGDALGKFPGILVVGAIVGIIEGVPVAAVADTVGNAEVKDTGSSVGDAV